MHLPFGTAGARHGWSVWVTPEQAGWAYSGLRVLDLEPGQTRGFATGNEEMLVLPLSGSATVECDGERFELIGRSSVFDRVSDFCYLPIGAQVSISSVAGGRFALPSARASRRMAARYGPAEEVPVEVRGAGPASRQVNNFCAPDTFECDKLVAVELLTPAGNWSSYPPHKHDARTASEAVLEEIYYFETRGPAYQQVYGSTNVLVQVHAGDVVLVPDGYHGPSMAAPGYDLYYLNVLAGPAAERSMAFCDDPAHAWVRGSWTGQPVDSRVPMTNHLGRTGT